MANPFTVQPLGGLQNIQMIGQGMQGIAQNVQADREEQERAQIIQQFSEAMDRGDPKEIAQLSLLYPEIGQSAMGGIKFANEATKANLRDSMQRVVAGEDPIAVLQERIQMVEAQGGDASDSRRELEIAMQDPEAYRQQIEGIYAMSFPAEYTAFRKATGGQDPTAFMQEMMAAGIQPGSEEYKSAVLERYGKGQTVGYDVVEAVNPQTGRSEYFQVSRTNPGDRIPLGIEVPVDPRVQAQQVKTESERQDRARQEMTTVTDMLDNVNQIIDSPGLESWSGIQAIAPVIPGTEQANTDALVERLQSQQFMKNIGQMRGLGALSNAEGQKVASAAAALRRNMTDDAVKEELNRIKTELEKARQRIESGQLLPPEERGQMPININAAEGRTEADRFANAAADAGVVNWSDL